MNDTPRVTVVVAACNAASTLEETLASVAAQTYRDFELIAVDDGSTDATPVLLARYARAHVWMRWVRQDNTGSAAARMRAIGLARGQYVALLDADDVWLPEKLAAQMAIFDRNPSVALVFSDEREFSPEGDAPLTRFQQKPPARGQVLPRLFFGNFILNSTVVVRKDALLAAGGFDPAHRVHEGIDVWLKLAERHDFDYVDKVLVRYRVRPESLSRSNRLACQRRDLEIMDYWIARRPDLFPDGSLHIATRRAQIHERMGRTLLAQQDYAGARSAFRRAIALGACHPGLLVQALGAHLPLLAGLAFRARSLFRSRGAVPLAPVDNLADSGSTPAEPGIPSRQGESR